MFSFRKFAMAGALLLSVSTPALAAKDLVVGVPDNLTGLDPHNINDTLSQSASRLILQGLFGFDKDMKLVPVLAESYEANPQATEFTIRLRKNVKFHDGTPFDAQAVKTNFERLANPENRLSRASLVNMVSQFTVVDDATIKLTLKEPFGAMINNLAHPGSMIHSPAALEKYGKEVLRNPVGTGPYKFVSWQADTLKVAKNENYWKQGLPKVDTVTLRSVPENGSRLAMLQAGEAQFIYPLPPEMASVAERNPKLDIITKPSIVTWYVAMNNLKKPFNDPRVRQALNYAVDKKAYAKIVYNGYADPMDSVVPPGLPFYVKQSEWPFDVAKAKELLKEAGYPDGFETEVFAGNNTTSIRAMQFLQQQLAQVNVKVKTTPLEAGVVAQRIWGVSKPEDATVQLYYGGWSASTGDADWQLRPLLFGESFPPKMFNVAYFSNPEVDASIRAAIATADNEKRAEAYKKAQEIAWKETPWIYLGVERLLAAKSKSLAGAYYLPDRGLLLEEAELN
jgi:glutathione transport system substrate-binding protein